MNGFGNRTVFAGLLLICIFSGGLQAAAADLQLKEAGVTVTLFFGRGCPHCENEKRFLSGLKDRFPMVAVRELEVWENRENANLYRRILDGAGIEQAAVPGTLVGAAFFIGFDGRTGEAIEEALVRCLREGCRDLLAQDAPTIENKADNPEPFDLPFIGSVDPAAISLPLFTVIIASLDSFNPCAFFVLFFLLSLLVHARSRKRMCFIGGTFVLFSGLVYFLFMVAWLNVFMITGALTGLTLAGGLVALAIGAVNVKDFFLFGRGVTLSIPEEAKPKLYKKMRELVRADGLLPMTAGTIMLAVTANTYEVLCTAGFPMVYTRVLTFQKLSEFERYQYLVFYNLIYVVPLALIVVAVTSTLGARKLTLWQGRKLKLISGLMMAALGVILIVAPGLLGNVLASVLLLSGVLMASAAVIAVTRRMRPGIIAEGEAAHEKDGPAALP